MIVSILGAAIAPFWCAMVFRLIHILNQALYLIYRQATDAERAINIHIILDEILMPHEFFLKRMEYYDDC
jgi:hypothetical protein